MQPNLYIKIHRIFTSGKTQPLNSNSEASTQLTVYQKFVNYMDRVRIYLYRNCRLPPHIDNTYIPTTVEDHLQSALNDETQTDWIPF